MIKKKSVKELLGESLAELLGSKPFEKITVNEIVENCGVGRRTFYRNFRDKYDLATWLYIRQLSEYTDSGEAVRLADFILHSAKVVNKDQQLIIAVDKYRGQITYAARIIAIPDISTPEQTTEFFLRCIPESLRSFI